MLHDSTYRHTILFYCVSLYLSSGCCIFYRLKVCSTLPRASLLALFFQQHLFTSCLWVTFGNYNISWVFHYVSVCWDLWTVICCYYHCCFEAPQLHLCKSVNLVCKFCMYSDCSIDELFPYSSSSPWASLFPETQQYWSQAINSK